MKRDVITTSVQEMISIVKHERCKNALVWYHPAHIPSDCGYFKQILAIECFLVVSLQLPSPCKAIEQHDAMISAIEAQESSLAIDLTLQHWDLSRDQMEKYVRPHPLPIDVISMKDRRNAV